ncbi:MAG: formate--tetrahydrofolate ligase [Armatimonadota bacterium]
MLTDVEIAQQAVPEPITAVAGRLGLAETDIELYGPVKAKVTMDAIHRFSDRPDGRLILVTGITPTPAGEGKTTTTIGLGDALRRLGHSACIAIREPSLGPCFGLKGGATGGGYAQVIPMVDINLHFNGDFHAITSAHNLLSALLDNHIHRGDAFNIDPYEVMWRRVIDMNDRSLREIVTGLGGRANGLPRQTGFDITTASEVMALLCLATDLEDLKRRLARIVVALDRQGNPVTAEALKASGAMAVLLRDAIKPNLVQTLEGTPAFVHGGPFGNIAHGCSSVIATRLALKLADYVITEAGFGSDLGAEKFFNIKCRTAGLTPACAVVVATVRALKMHGGAAKDRLAEPDAAALERGLENLWKHCENVELHGVPPVVAVNRFESDSEEELSLLMERCRERGICVALADHWKRGGEGAEDLARAVLETISKRQSNFRFLYDLARPIEEKVETIARQVYGADRVVFTLEAEKKLALISRLGFGGLPVCMAKTQNSLSDDPLLLGRPAGFRLTVRDARVSAGAGFVVIYTGTIMTMPGLPPRPAAENMQLVDGQVVGLS